MNLISVLEGAQEVAHVLEVAKAGDEAAVALELQKPEVASFIAHELVAAVKLGEGAIAAAETAIEGHVGHPG